MAGATLTIAAPARLARLGGIMSVADVITDARLGIGPDVVYQAEGCEFPYTEVLRCFAETPPPDKTASGIEVANAIGEPFTLVAGVRCFINSDLADFLRRAREQLAAGQDRALEEVFGVWADGGIALASGTSVAGAVATVEQELDDKYIGRGTIAMSRFDAVMADAAGVLKLVDGVPQTINGTPVLASGRIAPGEVYGTGRIGIVNNGVNEYEATDFSTNNHFAIAETQFALTVDCDFRVKSATS
uniref:Major capsid protein n=1 Tax=Microbacterium phage Judebell TaxID=3230835 RepID=A0AAU8EFN6_9CAUD